MNYGSYVMTGKDRMKCLASSVLITIFAAWLLYKSPIGVVLIVGIYPFLKKGYIEKKVEERRRKLLLQFKDAIQSVSVALLSGYSMENAWKEAEMEISELHGTDAYMLVELKEINQGIAMNQPIEELLYRFALRSQCEDILNFAEILRFAKRSGGNLGKIIKNTTDRINEKFEIEQEIETIISGKKMEQKVMNIVPVALLAYLNLTSGDFLEPLYGSLFGVCVMTIAFLAYLAAFSLSRKMIRYGR